MTMFKTTARPREFTGAAHDLPKAQRLFRVAAAIEHTVATYGARVTVQQIMRYGSLGHATFFRAFISLDSAIEQMLHATDYMCSWLARAAGTDELAAVYEDYLMRFPNLECLLHSVGGPRQIPSYRRPAYPTPWHMRTRKLSDLTNNELIAWARYVGEPLEAAK
jgi:hypothetical protein